MYDIQRAVGHRDTGVSAGIGDWLLIRLPDGKVGFIPDDAVKQK